MDSPVAAESEYVLPGHIPTLDETCLTITGLIMIASVVIVLLISQRSVASGALTGSTKG